MDKVKNFFKGIGGKIKWFWNALLGKDSAGSANENVDTAANSATTATEHRINPNPSFGSSISAGLETSIGSATPGHRGVNNGNLTANFPPATPVDFPKKIDFKDKIEFIDFLRSVPNNILTKEERMIIASVMSFGERKIDSVMAPKEDVASIRENDLLGPLALDKLHKTGFGAFPITNSIGRIVGVLNVDRLNNLNVRPTDTAGSYMEPTVSYARDDYTCEMALGVFIRTNAPFLVVVDKNERIKGFLYFEDLMYSLTGRDLFDGFSDDNSPRLVATRRIKN